MPRPLYAHMVRIAGPVDANQVSDIERFQRIHGAIATSARVLATPERGRRMRSARRALSKPGLDRIVIWPGNLERGPGGFAPPEHRQYRSLPT